MSILSVNFRLRNNAERNAEAPNTLLDLLQTEASFTTLETLTFCTYVDIVASIYTFTHSGIITM